MSDACFEGYTCHGPMEPVYEHETYDGIRVGAPRLVAWWCRCGVWRHATSPWRDQVVRAGVTKFMEQRVRDYAAFDRR